MQVLSQMDLDLKLFSPSNGTLGNLLNMFLPLLTSRGKEGGGDDNITCELL